MDCQFFQIIAGIINSTITSWPLAIFLMALLFRKKLYEMMEILIKKVGNISSVSSSGITFQENQSISASAEDVANTEKDLKEKKVIPCEKSEGKSTNNVNRVRALVQYFKTLPNLEVTANMVARDVSKLEIEDDITLKIEYLTYCLADNKLSWIAEMVDKYMFDSQVNILMIIDKSEGKKINKGIMQQHYQNIATKYPHVYNEWNVENYVKYMIKEGLLVEDESGYKLTEFGEYYCIYVGNMKSLNKDRNRSW